jgi:hypothetical protein
VPPRSPLRWTLVVAVAAHAAAAVWAARAPRPAAEWPSTTEAFDVTEAAIDVEAPAAESASTVVQPGEPPRAASLQARVATGLGAASHSGAVGSVEPYPGPVASSEPGAADGTWSFSPTTTAGPDGASGSGALSGDALASAMRSGVGATVAEDTKKREAFARKHAFLPVFTPRDLELGLVPDGQLVTLTRDLVRRSLAPTSGRALLEFDTDGAGVIASVRVLDVSSERGEWDRVAADLMVSARGTTLRVPTGANGIAVTLEVTSALKTVDGATAGDKSAFSKAMRAITDPVGSVTDATTRPRRIVATRVVDVQAF